MMVIPVNAAVVSFANTVPLVCGIERIVCSHSHKNHSKTWYSGFENLSKLFCSAKTRNVEHGVSLSYGKNLWAYKPSFLVNTKTVLHANPG
ncbi:MAG: hypothetical protein J6K90_02770 [Tidjanibacter sp.]|nr:hypothetical protein [Tidjanibacter sp.]MBR6830639.1 hypothetical protein [Tidjanibacter sp.]